MSSKKILVLGAGFGGLRAATLIAKKLRALGLAKKYEIVLIDRNDHHTYTPLLYEVATTSKETADLCALHEVAAYKVEPLIVKLPITFLKGDVMKLDLFRSTMHLGSSRKIKYDYVVLALGSEANFYGIKGLKGRSLPLKSFLDALKIRDAIWNLALDGQGVIRIVIGGGGSSGVELAGELKAWCGELEESFPKCRLDVTLVEAGPTILAGFHRKIVGLAERRLNKFGVTVIVRKKISEVKKREIILDDKTKMRFDMLVWAGGVKAAAIFSELSLRVEPKGLAAGEVGMCIPGGPELKLRPHIYGIGDGICFYDPLTQKPVPGVARAAIAQADVAAHNLVEDVKMHEARNTKHEARIYTPRYKKYKPTEYPFVIPVGGKWAVAKVGPIIISGFAGWVLKGLVELNYLLSIMPFWRALRIWLKGLRIFMQNDRLG